MKVIMSINGKIHFVNYEDIEIIYRPYRDGISFIDIHTAHSTIGGSVRTNISNDDFIRELIKLDTIVKECDGLNKTDADKDHIVCITIEDMKFNICIKTR